MGGEGRAEVLEKGGQKQLRDPASTQKRRERRRAKREMRVEGGKEGDSFTPTLSRLWVQKPSKPHCRRQERPESPVSGASSLTRNGLTWFAQNAFAACWAE